MALTWTSPEDSAEQIRRVKAETKNPFFINFALAFPPVSLDAALDSGAPIISFSWGDPSPFLPRVRSAGAHLGIQVTNVAGVSRALDQEADFLICQGNEAGGHVQSNTPLCELLPRIVDAAGDVSVIAAGGIASGSQIAKVLSMGAKGAVLGTRFVATKESRAHEDYKRSLVETAGATALTVCFDGAWPYSAHRVLRNSTLEAWEAAGSPPVGARPGEGDTIAVTAGQEAIYRYEDTAPKAGYSGDIEAMCLYSGTGSGEIQDIPSAGDLVERLWQECAETLSNNNASTI